MKKLRYAWLNIKINTAWRLQFMMGLLKTTIKKKYFLDAKKES